MRVLALRTYINKEFGGSQRDFAIAQGVQPAQVTQWIKKDFIVVDNQLFSYRRDLVKQLSVGTDRD